MIRKVQEIEVVRMLTRALRKGWGEHRIFGIEETASADNEHYCVIYYGWISIIQSLRDLLPTGEKEFDPRLKSNVEELLKEAEGFLEEIDSLQRAGTTEETEQACMADMEELLKRLIPWEHNVQSREILALLKQNWGFRPVSTKIP